MHIFWKCKKQCERSAFLARSHTLDDGNTCSQGIQFRKRDSSDICSTDFALRAMRFTLFSDGNIEFQMMTTHWSEIWMPALK